MTMTNKQQQPRERAPFQMMTWPELMSDVLTILLRSRSPLTVGQLLEHLRPRWGYRRRCTRCALAYFMAMGLVRRSGAGGARDLYRYQFAGWPRLPIRERAARAAAPPSPGLETPPEQDLKHPHGGPPVRPPTGTTPAEVEGER